MMNLAHQLHQLLPPPTTHVVITYLKKIKRLVRFRDIRLIVSGMFASNFAQHEANDDGGQPNHQQSDIKLGQEVHAPSFALTRLCVKPGSAARILFVAFAATAAGCDDKPRHQTFEPGQSVEWFLANPQERQAQLERCKANPKGLMFTPNCVNSVHAEKQARWDKAMESPIDIDPSKSWEQIVNGPQKQPKE